jgi:hypothetical protein
MNWAVSNPNDDTSASPAQDFPLQVADKYNEIFEIEIDCWCYGFVKFPGEITPALVHRVIKELTGIFKAAIDHNYVFNLHETAQLIFESVGKVIDEKEITFAILAQFPQPYELSEDGQFIMAQIIDQAEQRYGGVLERLEKKWKNSRPAKKHGVDKGSKDLSGVSHAALKNASTQAVRHPS